MCCYERVKLLYRNAFDTSDVFKVKLKVVLPKLNENSTSNLYFLFFTVDMSDVGVYMYIHTIFWRLLR